MTLRIMSAICFDIALCLFNLFPCVNTTSQIGFTDLFLLKCNCTVGVFTLLKRVHTNTSLLLFYFLLIHISHIVKKVYLCDECTWKCLVLNRLRETISDRHLMPRSSVVCTVLYPLRRAVNL